MQENTAFFPGSSLAGNGLIVSDGDTWCRQRRLSDPTAYKHRAFNNTFRSDGYTLSHAANATTLSQPIPNISQLLPNSSRDRAFNNTIRFGFKDCTLSCRRALHSFLVHPSQAMASSSQMVTPGAVNVASLTQRSETRQWLAMHAQWSILLHNLWEVPGRGAQWMERLLMCMRTSTSSRLTSRWTRCLGSARGPRLRYCAQIIPLFSPRMLPSRWGKSIVNSLCDARCYCHSAVTAILLLLS